MAHLRKRDIQTIFKKQMRFWPVTALLGPRQCGKSTFLRELLWNKDEFTLKILDKAAVRRRAQNSPELFLKEVEKYPLVIDEITKAPALFDEIKSVVDQKRIPGQFVITGSVQFSKKIGIRESLTGRSAHIRMDTLTLIETKPVKLDLGSVSRYLEGGGMPGVCFLRDKDHRESYWEQWIETTCERDLKFFSKGRLSSELARRILELTAELEYPTLANIASQIRVDARRIETHIEALEALFIVIRLNPHLQGVGKPFYVPFDTGLACHLGASLRRRWQGWFLTEFINHQRFRSISVKSCNYYLTQRGSFVDFARALNFYLYSELASPDRRELMTARAVIKRFPEAQVSILCATDEPTAKIDHSIFVVPWKEVIDHGLNLGSAKS